MYIAPEAMCTLYQTVVLHNEFLSSFCSYCKVNCVFQAYLSFAMSSVNVSYMYCDCAKCTFSTITIHVGSEGCAVMTGIIPARFELFESDEEKLFHLTTTEHCIIVVVIRIFEPVE